MQYTQQQRLAPEVPDESALYGPILWNSLPPDIVSCDTLPRFRRELKTFLSYISYRQSYLSWFSFFPRGPCGFYMYLGQVKKVYVM